MTNTPAPTTQAGRRLIDMLAQIDPEPQGLGWVRNAILNIESEARSTPAEALPPEALEWARQLVQQGYRDEHIVTFTEDGYGLEHPIRCRPNLIGCILNEWLRTQVAPDREPGRYVMEWAEDGPKYTRLSRNEEAD